MENRIWDFPTCWSHLTDAERQRLRERLADALRSGEDLKGIVLTRAELENFDFAGANLSGAFFNGCNLSKSKFIETDLTRAFFGGANLENADLTRAELHGAVFTGTKLKDVRLLAYSIRLGRVPINLEMRCFGEKRVFKRPHVNESNPFLAEPTYRALKIYFINDGDYDSASWASYCERVMQRKTLWQRKHYIDWLLSLLFSAVSGYGEKPSRAFTASLSVVVLYAFLYWGFRLVTTNTGENIKFFDALYFSALTFSGMSFSELIPHSNIVARLLVTTEAFGGIFALSLFVFTLTKRYVAR
jgi:hypothetical protein